MAYRITSFDHTADKGIIVHADRLTELFAGAAVGMFWMAGSVGELVGPIALGIVAQTCDRVAVMYAGNVVEVANVFDLFRRPLHPYTVALLQAIVAPENLDDLHAIEGSVPDLIRPPTGCRFHPRCPHAMDVCRAVKPPTTEPFPGRTVACYLFPEDENH